MIAKVLPPDGLVGRIVRVQPDEGLRPAFYGMAVARVLSLPGAPEQYVVAPDSADEHAYFARVSEIAAVD